MSISVRSATFDTLQGLVSIQRRSILKPISKGNLPSLVGQTIHCTTRVRSILGILFIGINPQVQIKLHFLDVMSLSFSSIVVSSKGCVIRRNQLVIP